MWCHITAPLTETQEAKAIIKQVKQLGVIESEIPARVRTVSLKNVKGEKFYCNLGVSLQKSH